ncbi:hypothetical protein TAMA11512_14720 [Selenomonas sp. TAMA-11512]|uniref:LysM peptidoglycan-binding domain-containing protein n=1 Tax=Selenomonas sp. TAMA-11512 TaxID=3095337 RepID=UPI00308EF72B|nr:hypothetical protein TAMA11512_14720 [Selenomonas sp. TAMA-11512]
MQKKLIIVFMLAFFLGVLPLNLGNAYLRCSDFDTVTIARGDTVYSIAERYATDGDFHDLQEAIIEINGLDTKRLIVGQEIRIPVRRSEI